MTSGERNVELSVVLPCRNEEGSIGGCIKKIKEVFKKHKINGEIIVSDSSTDGSPEIAKKLGVVLVKHDKKGYGRAYLEGFKVAKGKYIFCADSDGTYDFSEIPNFLKYLRKDYDFVIGNRFRGEIAKGAMLWWRGYIGNPLITLVVRVSSGSKIGDALCGMRAFKRKALDKLSLASEGMEFASETIIKATKAGFRIKELPINYYKRKGKSKLRAFSDGSRHLRFIVYSLFTD